MRKLIIWYNYKYIKKTASFNAVFLFFNYYFYNKEKR